MTTSRVYTAHIVSSTSELIPAAGQWTRNEHKHAYPCSTGQYWHAQSGGVTPRRQEIGDAVTFDQRTARPGTQDKNCGSYKNFAPTRTPHGNRAPNFRPAQPPPRKGQPPAMASPRRDELERDWYRQRKTLRSRSGASSWTGPHHMRKGHVSGDDDFDSIRPASAYGDFQPTDYVVDPPRTADVLRRCESTMIPGVGWGDLLARDRRGFAPISIGQDGCLEIPLTDGRDHITGKPLGEKDPVYKGVVKIVPTLLSTQRSVERLPYTAPSLLYSGQCRTPDLLYSNFCRLHPLGKEAKFAESLRGEGTGLNPNYKLKTSKKPKPKSWDSSYAHMAPSLFDRTLSATIIQQKVCNDSRLSRYSNSFTSTPALGITAGWEKPPKSADALIRSVDEKVKSKFRHKQEGSRILSLTGGSFDLSCQLSAACLRRVKESEKGVGIHGHLAVPRDYVNHDIDSSHDSKQQKNLKTHAGSVADSTIPLVEGREETLGEIALN